MDNRQEYIVCSAIYVDDFEEHVHQPKNVERGIVVCGLRHHNCFAILSELYNKQFFNTLINKQGFLTSTDRFVERKEAALIALRAGQITELKYSKDELDSSDLY